MLELLLIITSASTIVAWIVAYIGAMKGTKHNFTWLLVAIGVSLAFICVAAKHVSESIIM